MNNFSRGRRVLASLWLAGMAGGAAAQGVTGDWGGRRDAWQDKGIALDLGYTVEAARNTAGGLRRASAHAGQLSATGLFDLERLWGWGGTRGQLSLSLRDGDSVTSRAGLGSLMASQEIHGRGHILRLGSLWLGRQSADGRFDIKAGRLAVGEDFNMLDCVAINLTLCGGQVALLGGDYWFNSPLSQWGAVVTYRPLPAVYLRAAAYQINPRYADERGGGLRLAPAGTVGTLTPLELGWEPSFEGRSGRYAVGGWYSSAARADAVQPLPTDVVGSLPLLRNGAHGGWASAQQQLTRGNGSSEASGLRTQLAYAQGDRRTGDIDQMLNLQLIQTGTMPSRPQDRIGLGVATTRVNPRAAAVQRQRSGDPLARREKVAEVFYGWRPAVGLDLQPSFQYVRHPGGTGLRKDAVVVGIKADVRF